MDIKIIMYIMLYCFVIFVFVKREMFYSIN